MMPDLGAYRTEVLAAYGISIAILVLLVVLSLWRHVRVKASLQRIEEGRDG